MNKQKTPKPEADTLALTDSSTTTQSTQLEQAKAWTEFVRSLTPHEALIKAISECENVTAQKINPQFRSKYFGLSDLLSAIKPVLGRYGLAAFQIPCSNADRVWISTSIIHTSGHTWACGDLGVAAGNLTQQNIGSVFTYLKRYALSTLMGVASETEDDDGHLASKQPAQGYAKPAAPQGQPAPKPLPSGNWVADFGLTGESSHKVATELLVSKGWLAEGAALSALPQDKVQELSTQKMKQAFLEAIKQKLA